MGWTGWRSFALSLVYKSTTKPELGLFQHDPRRFLAFLGGLARGKHLENTKELEVVWLAWSKKIEAFVVARLKDGKWKEGSREESASPTLIGYLNFPHLNFLDLRVR
jgi:hypothetical protein